MRFANAVEINFAILEKFGLKGLGGPFQQLRIESGQRPLRGRQEYGNRLIKKPAIVEGLGHAEHNRAERIEQLPFSSDSTSWATNDAERPLEFFGPRRLVDQKGWPLGKQQGQNGVEGNFAKVPYGVRDFWSPTAIGESGESVVIEHICVFLCDGKPVVAKTICSKKKDVAKEHRDVLEPGPPTG